MKSFVIYLIVFFISASLIRGIFGIHDKTDRIYHNKYLDAKLKEKKKEQQKYEKKHPKAKQQISHSSVKGSITKIETKGSDLKPIDKKYLKLSIRNNLSKEFSNIDPKYGNLKLVIDINMQKFTPKIYTTTRENKLIYHYDLDTQINAIYNLYNKFGKRVARGQAFIKQIVKGKSDVNALESERITRKTLFSIIGKKIATDLNKKTFIFKLH